MCDGCDLLKPVRFFPKVSLYRCKIKAIDKHCVVPELMNKKTGRTKAFSLSHSKNASKTFCKSLQLLTTL